MKIRTFFLSAFGFAAVLVLLLGLIDVWEVVVGAEQHAFHEAAGILSTLEPFVADRMAVKKRPEDLLTLRRDTLVLRELASRQIYVLDENRQIVATDHQRDIGIVSERPEIEQTMRDGTIRSFEERGARYPQGRRWAVSSIRIDNHTIGALLLDCTGIYAAADDITWERIRYEFLGSLAGSAIVALLGAAVYKYVSKQNQLMEESLRIKEAGERLRDEFLANMSHEIRTPLNAILGLTYLTLNTKLTAPQRDYLKKAHTAGHSLLRIADDILDFSKVQAGKVTLESVEFSMDEVIGNLTSILAHKAEEKGLALEIAIDPKVPSLLIGDPFRLGQILLNLVGNAIKFTSSGHVAIQVAPLEFLPDSVVVRFEIQDTGMGMTPDQVQGLFGAFYQADSSITRKYGGTGLGLAISRQLVELLGGQISVQSEEQKGSSFVFTCRFQAATEGLPESEILQSEAAPVLTMPGALRGGRILVAKDNPINQQITRELLEQAGLQVDVVDDGGAAVEMVLGCGASCKWDIVLMDLQMPVMDGYTATAAIRSDARFKRLPILAMTAHVLSEERERCVAAGIDDYITKPVDPARFYETLGRWMALKPSRGSGSVEVSRMTMPLIEGVDVKAGLARVADNSRLYLILLIEFAQRGPAEAASLRTMLAQGDAETLGKTAHALKGAAGNLGILEVEECAVLAESSPLTATESLCRSLESNCAKILAALLGGSTATPTVAVSPKGDLSLLLGKFRRELETADGASLDTLEQIKGFWPPERARNLVHLVNEFDFPEALVELDRLTDGA